MQTLLTQDLLARGYAITLAGTYALASPIYVSVPTAPSAKNWSAFAQGRPCVISVRAHDVVVDLRWNLLAAATELARGLVLVYVAPGVQNVRIMNGTLGTCGIGIFLDTACAAAAVTFVTTAQFLEKGILAYSPQGLVIEDCIVGPNLSALSVSQELDALRLYGVAPAAIAGWQASEDDLPLPETAHVAGISIVPDAAHDAPFPVPANTGSGVQLTRVDVLPLTMYFREHSLLLGLGAVTGAVTKASGVLGEVLPEYYALRRAVAQRMQKGFYPSLAEPQRSFVTDAGGFLINTGYEGGPEEQVTTWVRGVDREGNAVRGVQAVLIVGAGTPVLTAVEAATPVFVALRPRVRLPPRHVPKSDLASAKRAFGIVVLPADPPAPQPCCPDIGAAAYFSRERVLFNAQPTYGAPTLHGSTFGVSPGP